MSRTGARNLTGDIALSIEDKSFLTGRREIFWSIYSGATPEGAGAGGWDPTRNGAWCIPSSLLKQGKEWGFDSRFMGALRNQGLPRFIRFTNADVKRNYNEGEWVVVARPPRDTPLSGHAIPYQRPDRHKMMAVPDGLAPHEITAGKDLQSRIRTLKRERSRATNLRYPRGDEEWYGNVQQTSEGIAVHPPELPASIFNLTKDQMTANVQTTVLKHDPSQLVFMSEQVNPLSAAMPSTNTIPVQTHIPYLSEAIFVMSLISAAAQFFNTDKFRVNSKYTSKTYIAPTEVIDYEQLKQTDLEDE